jgi:lipoprotein NlpI
MSKYNIDLDYALPMIDISKEELNEIIAEADSIISESRKSKEKLAVTCLKKEQCLQKLLSFGYINYIFFDDLILKDGEINRLLEKALELFPDMPEALMQLGINSYDAAEEDNDASLYLFSKALQLKPDYAAAFNNRAMLFYYSMFKYEPPTTKNKEKGNGFEKAKNNFRSAVTDLTEAIRIRPFDALYYLNRGKFHSILGKQKDALKDFTNAINYAPDTLRNQIRTDVLIFISMEKEYVKQKDYIKACYATDKKGVANLPALNRNIFEVI